jgi:hypothetical protein
MIIPDFSWVLSGLWMLDISYLICIMKIATVYISSIVCIVLAKRVRSKEAQSISRILTQH